MLPEMVMQINRILTKLRRLKLGAPVIMPHRGTPTFQMIVLCVCVCQCVMCAMVYLL